MALRPEDIDLWRNRIAQGLGLTHLGWALAADIVDVVERMHGTISRAPLPWAHPHNDRAGGLSGLIYRLIRQSMNHLDRGFAEASLALRLDQSAEDPAWIRLQAAVNGVLGDQLDAQASPLSLTMRLIQQPAAVTDHRRRIIFLHGLCMSELGWQHPAHADFCQWNEHARAARISYLRYNTGRRISQNGQDLAALLESLDEDLELDLIGHSMGGLLIRSALHAAAGHGHRWPSRLRHVAMLGSPHHGAPLERIGQQANGLLTLSPYLKPFSRLGARRSAGIRDLRFGNLTDADWQDVDPDHRHDTRHPLPLPEGPRYLNLAASRSPALPEPVWRGRDDLLVTVPSALGQSRDPGRRLHHNHLQSQVLPGLNHLQLLSDARVYDSLRNWLQGALRPG